ncbi:MAG: M48 family metallopeptidase [Anaerolineales bacterium]|nr:M48 family metallopeptidase [Anaerolineales bacterium]
MIEINQIIRTKRRSIALIIQPDGKLIVRAPLKASDKIIHAFVQKKASWIHSKQALVKSASTQATPKKFLHGEKFWHLGELYPLQIVDQANQPLEFNGRFTMSLSAQSQARSHFIKWYKASARKIITERVVQYATRNGFTYSQVKITSAQSRWGSCSGKGSLCFSWRLVMAPLTVIDYVVVHELVHLRHKNHSKAFWAEVKALMPDYKNKRSWLKENGRLLNI